MITFFTTPKPFDDPHINIIQRNAIQSWKQLDVCQEILIMGSNPEIPDIATELECASVYLEDNTFHVPLVRDLFDAASDLADSNVLAYVNTDVILFDDFSDTIRKVHQDYKNYMVIGHRMEAEWNTLIDFTNSEWSNAVRSEINKRGTLHSPTGMDYFVLPREHWNNFPKMPDLLMAGTYFDNWLAWAAKQCGELIDATASILAFHQSHSYRTGGMVEKWIGYNRAQLNLQQFGDIRSASVRL